MIARMWHGQVPNEKAKLYHQFLLQTGLVDYGKTNGNKGVLLLRKEDEEVTHFYTLTFWKDLASIKLFAGEEFKKARYYPEDKDFLLEFEPEATHFDILVKPDYIPE